MSMTIFGVDPVRQQAVTTIGRDVTDGSLNSLKTTSDGIVLEGSVTLQ